MNEEHFNSNKVILARLGAADKVGKPQAFSGRYSSKRLCQVDIADIYDHKHQPLSESDVSRGLSKMSHDIIKAIWLYDAVEKDNQRFS